MKKHLFFILFGLLIGFILGFGSYHTKAFPYHSIKAIFGSKTASEGSYSLQAGRDTHREWAQKIIEGGYILHIRHAMREKWLDVTAFDQIELLSNVDARETDYYRAVCLTEKGIEEAKLVGQVFSAAGMKISYVLSSPSCRARETAIFAFNRIDQIEPSILHRTAQPISQHKDMGRKLREVIEGVQVQEGKNVIISGHGGTLMYDYNNSVGIVDENQTSNMDDRKETGIIVIEKTGEKYIARHKFNSIKDFAVEALEMPTDDTSGEKFLFRSLDKYSPKNVNKGLIFHHDDSG